MQFRVSLLYSLSGINIYYRPWRPGEKAMRALKILFIINNNLTTTEEVQEKITFFQQTMKKYAAMKNVKPEYYLLYSGFHVPSYALQTPEMIHYALSEQKKSEEILENFGRVLAIPEDNRFLAEGNPDLHASRIAHALDIDKVIGYSKWFIKLQSFVKSFELLFGNPRKIKKFLVKTFG